MLPWTSLLFFEAFKDDYKKNDYFEFKKVNAGVCLSEEF